MLRMITRRLFVAAMAGAGAPRPLVLEAIAAEKMPHRLIVHGVEPSAFFELRDYGAGAAQVARALEPCGITAAWTDGGKLLFGFPTLEQREKAWRLAASREEWAALRDRVVLKEISVYAQSR